MSDQVTEVLGFVEAVLPALLKLASTMFKSGVSPDQAVRDIQSRIAEYEHGNKDLDTAADAKFGAE